MSGHDLKNAKTTISRKSLGQSDGHFSVNLSPKSPGSPKTLKNSSRNKKKNSKSKSMNHEFIYGKKPKTPLHNHKWNKYFIYGASLD